MSDVAERAVETVAVPEFADKMHETEIEQNQLVARNKVAAGAAIKRSNQPDLADPLVGPSTPSMSPGAMQMSAIVKFHSTQSINLFRGRKGDPANSIRPIIGLARFARQVSLVWSAAAIDDPYADQVLLDIEQAYEAAKSALEAREKTMKELLEGMKDFEVTLQASIEPVEITLQFYSPWGFRGAMLLKQFDNLVRMALTARHIGIFTDGDWISVVRDSARALRHMFNEVDGWVSTGVKRDDIRNNTAVARRAAQRYQDIKKGYLVVDQEVINGHYRAKLSPVNRILEKQLHEAAVDRVIANGMTMAGPLEAGERNASAATGKVAPQFGFNTVDRKGERVADIFHAASTRSRDNQALTQATESTTIGEQ